MTQPVVLTLEDANQRLPYIRSIVRDIVTLAGELQDQEERLEEIRRLQGDQDGDSPHAEEFEQQERMVLQEYRRFDELEDELHQVGVSVVDRNSGLVEVKSQLEDRPVWLNWQPDEPEFQHWRTTSDDPMSRRRLLESVAEGSDDLSGNTDSGC